MKTVQHDLIKLRAYEIWELGGYPHGLDKKHWEQAEKELLDPAQDDNPTSNVDSTSRMAEKS